jgi:hypothetical protein
MTGISKQPYDRDFKETLWPGFQRNPMTRILKLRSSCKNGNLPWGTGIFSSGKGGVVAEWPFWLGISIGLNVCCCVRDRYTSSLLSCTQLTRRPKKAWVVNSLAYFIVEVCVSCAGLFSPIRLLLAWKFVASLGMECRVEIERRVLFWLL